MAYRGKLNPATLLNPHKYKGDITNIIWRSLWERNTIRWLDANPNIIEWSSEEFFIPYHHPIKGYQAKYYPDLFIKTADGKSIMVEIKPKKETAPPPEPKRKTQRYLTEVATYVINQKKWEEAKKVCDYNKVEFQVWTEDDLHRMGIVTSSTTAEVRKEIRPKMPPRPKLKPIARRARRRS